MTPNPAIDHHPTPPRATRREWIGLAVIALPCLLYSMDLTVLNLAVPQLTADLKPSASQLLWIVDIYGFMVAGALITMGTLGDRIGRRKLLVIGAVGFGAASVLAAFSTSAGMLIAARALLGLAAATLAPSTLSLIRNMFLDPAERTVAIGIWISSFSAGAAIGPLVGGILLTWFWWGSVFLIAVPVMVLLVVLAPLLLPEYRDPQAGRLDLVSAAMSLVAVLSVIYGVKRIAEGEAGFAAPVVIAFGVLVALAFLWRQRRMADPLVDLSLFSSAAFSASLAVNMLGFFAAFGIFLLTAQYLQLVLGLSPFMAGIFSAPSALGFIAGSMLAPALLARARPAFVMASGYALAAAGFLVIALSAETQSLALIILGYVLLSLGLGPVFTLATDLIIGTVPPERAGSAAGLAETSSELGGALGIAVLGSVVTAIYRRTISVPDGIAPDVAERARDTIGGAVAEALVLGDAGEGLTVAARSAYAQAFEFAALLGAGGLLAAAVAAAILLRTVTTSGAEGAEQAA
ncbi:MFS transporter [Aquibium carbonis]|uniref:MFS transporter n=1 Tax=Aquibium carbonis TaxID=2495581 RepID=A0A3R9Y967_9HYPH|nr:MFS transporter [Aquibium carbonis]RST86955.1 MFS transporter [Aquibium carbonis]